MAYNRPMPSEYLYGTVAGFKVDVEALRAHYDSTIKSIPALEYKVGDPSYVGWSVLSRDASLEDGIRRVSLDPKKQGIPMVQGTKPTPICTGPLLDAIRQLQGLGLWLYRTRMMRLQPNGREMNFHRDAKNESWRLHVPIYTNPGCFFEWRLQSGKVERVHFPADGRGYFVRVDVTHRAVNKMPEGATRVHLLCGVRGRPSATLYDNAFRL